MDSAVLAGRTTSRIGLGCGRLAGGAGAKASRKIVDQARALEITHFDVAPSYGLGLAENVLGEALAGDDAVTIATKVGIGRPSNAALKSVVREVLKPLLLTAPALRQKLGARVGGSVRGQFVPSQVEASLDQSLRRLRRDRVDALLLHEPIVKDLTPDLTEAMDAILRDGRAGMAGVGTGGDFDTLVSFGSIRQYRWSPFATLPETSTDIVHGMIRRYPKPASGDRVDSTMRVLGFDPADPAAWPGMLLTLALASQPNAIVLISSTDPGRLRASVEAIDWEAARGKRPGFVDEAQALLIAIP